MRKKLWMFLALVLALCMTAGCGTSKKAAEATTESEDDYYDEEIPEEPKVDNPEEYVKLGTYKGLTVTQKSAKVTDKEVEEVIKENVETEYEDITDRDTVKKGDILNINYVVTSADGVELEDYMDEDFQIYLGENYLSFSSVNLDDKLVGKKVGDIVTVESTFVEDLADNYDDVDFDFEDGGEYDDYDDLDASGLEVDDPNDDDGQEPYYEEEAEAEDEDLAGQPFTIDITINAIQKEVMPELTDEYVKDIFDYDSVEAYRADVRKELEDSKKEEVENNAISDLLLQIVNNSEQIKEFPADLVKEESDYLSDEIYMSMYDMEEDETKTFEEYFKENYPDYETLEDYAKFRLKDSCVYDLLVKEYQIDPTEEEITKTAESYVGLFYESVEEVREEMTEEELKAAASYDILIEKLKADNTFKVEE